VWHPPTWSTLAVIAVVLGITFGVSWRRTRPTVENGSAPDPAQEAPVARENATV
jgi:hypothetical protein